MTDPVTATLRFRDERDVYITRYALPCNPGAAAGSAFKSVPGGATGNGSGSR
jgi:hypothetical protein